MNNPEEELKLQLRPRPKETVSLDIPKDTLESLKKVAVNQDIAVLTLVRYKHLGFCSWFIVHSSWQ
jgi:hypothetical protein